MVAFWSKILKKKENESVRSSVTKKKEPAAEETIRTPMPAKGESRNVLVGILRSMHVTEKAAKGEQNREYVFKVALNANKYQVKQAVEGRYNVHVDSVRTVTTHGKERRRGRHIGWKPGFKKAMVKIKEGQTIEAR